MTTKNNTPARRIRQARESAAQANETIAQQLGALAGSQAPGMQTIRAGRAMIRVTPESAAMHAQKFRSLAKNRAKPLRQRQEHRFFPDFVPGVTSTAAYVAKYIELNECHTRAGSFGDLFDLDTLNTKPSALYENGATDYTPTETTDHDHEAGAAVAATLAIAKAQAGSASSTPTEAQAELVTCDGPDAEAGAAADTPAPAADAVGADHAPTDSDRTGYTDPLKTQAHAGDYTHPLKTQGAGHLRADYLRAADGGNTQQASSKTGAWSAVMFRTSDGRAGLAFNRPGQDAELIDHATGPERMRALQAMAQAAEQERQQREVEAMDPTPDCTPAHETQAEDTAPEFQRTRPAHVDLRALIAQGMAPADLVGLGVHYSGDMANASGSGAIVEVQAENPRALRVVVTLEDGRHMTHLDGHSFSDHPGSRFALDFKRHGAPYLAELAGARVARTAAISSAKEVKAQQHAAERERLAAEFPHLERADSNHGGGKLAARNIRTLLKAAFPGVKFSVTSDYSKVSTRWTDGPTEAAVQAIIGRFDIGRADYNTDYFYTEASAWSELFGGVQYLWTNREESPELIARALEAWNEKNHATATAEDWKKQASPFSYTDRSAEWNRRNFRETLNAMDATPPAKARAKSKITG